MKKWIGVLFLLCSTALGSVGWAAPININTASEQEISTELNGIGDNKAKAIVQYREKHGPFPSLVALSKVKGIGNKILEKNKTDIIFK